MIIDTKQTILKNKFIKLRNMIFRSPFINYLFAAFTRPIRNIFHLYLVRFVQGTIRNYNKIRYLQFAVN